MKRLAVDSIELIMIVVVNIAAVCHDSYYHFFSFPFIMMLQ